MAQRRMRVLVVVIDLAGGTGTFCRLLATGLSQGFPDEFDVSALLLRDRELRGADHALFSDIRVIGTDVHDDWRRMFETPFHAWRLRRAVRRSDADLIFTVGTYANLLAPAGARGRPVVLSVHVHSTTQLQRSRFGGVIGAIMRRRYRKYPIAVPTQGVADDLARNFHATRVTVIPHGIEHDRVHRLADEPVPDWPTQRPYCIAVGRLTPQKNYPLLLAAFADARKRGVNEDLLIVGEGDQRPSLEQQITELGLTGRVHLIGHRPNPFPYIKRARLLILSSIWEGFGLSLLEAMALGVPVIACDCPSGPADILSGGEHGLLVPVNDTPALADAIHRLASDESMHAELSRKSVSRAGELSLRRMASAYRDLFTSALAGR